MTIPPWCLENTFLQHCFICFCSLKTSIKAFYKKYLKFFLQSNAFFFFTYCRISSGSNSFVWKAWNDFSLAEINLSVNLKGNLVFAPRETVFNLLLQVSRPVKGKITDLWDASPPGSQETDPSVWMGEGKRNFFLVFLKCPLWLLQLFCPSFSKVVAQPSPCKLGVLLLPWFLKCASAGIQSQA